MATEGKPEDTAEQPPPDAMTELRQVIAKAKTGDASALPQLRTLLDRNPALIRHYGDLARHAEGAWIGLASGSDFYLRETLTRNAEARRTELTRPGATPIEKLLVERVVATLLQVSYFEATEAASLAAGDTYRQLQFHAKRLGQAQRSHLAALGALVTYQKLMPVAVEAGVVNEHVAASAEHEVQTPAQDAVQQTVPRVPVHLADTDVDEPEREVRERQRVRIGA